MSAINRDINSSAVRIPSLFEIFWGKLANWFRRLAQWRKQGLLKRALVANRQRTMRIEPLEPRVLLSADVSYAFSAPDAAHFADGDALNNQYILDIFDDSGVDKLRLRAEDGTVLGIGSNVLSDDGVNKISITGVDVLGDRLTINLTNIAGQIGTDPRYDIEVTFDGGGIDVNDDRITISGTGTYELESFKLTGKDDIIIAGSIQALGDITIESNASSDGGLL